MGDLANMTNHYVELFTRLIDRKMYPIDVNEYLVMPQCEFLQALSVGISEFTGRKITRMVFAELAEISQKSVYSYFASPGARDYRVLSTDSRIAIIWRIVTNIPDPSVPANRPPSKRSYIVNGKMMFLSDAAGILGYSRQSTLSRSIRRNGLKLGDDISHLKNTKPGITKPRLFIVNGEQVSLNVASRMLGYKGTGSLSNKIEALGLHDGSDISQLKRRSPSGPSRGKITSRGDTLTYSAGDKIECLECGKKYVLLDRHLRSRHRMTCDEYRDKYNIPASIALAGAAYREMHQLKINASKKTKGK
ncbi:hypothetical protein M568_09875 [Salmonella enterica subsp. enterica serovar Namur str. 05-2929]|uniref:MucR family transcriptional regulator n=1 Tax=Salmonella enterica TaxID=28901 RepID=UPI000433D48A|nr:MucR family transcriptional regulator [Salmonella enterica]EXX82100.1 hypothetical protein M568_09875 [Salmonella enterica subsp. enterica serovar Namur str. 05-2929]